MEKDFFFLYQSSLSNNNHSLSIWGETSDHKTIIYHARGQMQKNIINYHEKFEQAQTQSYSNSR